MRAYFEKVCCFSVRGEASDARADLCDFSHPDGSLERPLAGRDSSTTPKSTARLPSTRASGSPEPSSRTSPARVCLLGASCSTRSARNSCRTASVGELLEHGLLVRVTRQVFLERGRSRPSVAESQLHRELASGVSFPIGTHFFLHMWSN